MNTFKATLIISMLAIFAVASQAPQSPEPPLDDKRLTIHTLVREDIFAGFLQNDMTRLARGEKNIDLLMEKRPGSKAELMAWKGGATLYRAVRAFEEKHPDEFKQKYQQVLDTFDQAEKLQPGNGGVAAVQGGSLVLFADQLPKELRAAAWERAYSSFQILWKQQGAGIEKMPTHFKGELLGGLAQAALRTGRKEEANQYLDKILAVLPNTPYEPIAKRWKADSKSAENSTIACLTCHDGGRLSARLTALNGK
jgi:tetratricopeptide (TPR) repeat protein